MKRWTVVERDRVFESRVFALDRLTCSHPEKSGHNDFFILDCPDWVNVVARDAAGRYVLVRQHRLGTGEDTLETPAGLIECGEDPVEAARRELLEETGHRAGNIVLMKKLTANPAIMNNSIYFYFAEGCEPVSSQSLDFAEDIEVLLVGEERLRDMLAGGEINHSIIVNALNLYFLWRERRDEMR